MKNSYEYPDGSASKWYEEALTTRNPVENRAKKCSKLTLPSVMPEDDNVNGSNELHSGYQSVGARGTKNLASKLLLALMPPNTPFFKLVVDDVSKAELTSDKEAWSKIEEALGKMERIVQTHIETSGIRVTVFEALLHTIITGNVLLDVPEDEPARMMSLRQYCVLRQSNGPVLKMVFKEEIHKENLTEAQKQTLGVEYADNSVDNARYGIAKDTVCVYTCIKRDGSKWAIHQEIKGEKVPQSEGQTPIDAPRFIPIRWRKIDNEDYGRGFVEEVIGDLSSLEGLSQAIVEGAGIMSKIVFLVNPNGVTSKNALESANGDITDGNADDVTVVQAEKAVDLSYVKQQADAIEKRLELAFLLNTAVQRQAERVTAEEIRFIAQELEDTQGGIYSILANEVLMPFLNRELTILQKKGKLPKLPKESIKVQIVAGLEALGRSHELNRLDALVKDLAQTFGPEALNKYINAGEYVRRRATALAVPPEGLLRTNEEIAQIEQIEQMSNVANSRVAPEVVKRLGGQQGQPPAQQTPAS